MIVLPLTVTGAAVSLREDKTCKSRNRQNTVAAPFDCSLAQLLPLRSRAGVHEAGQLRVAHIGSGRLYTPRIFSSHCPKDSGPSALPARIDRALAPLQWLLHPIFCAVGWALRRLAAAAPDGSLAIAGHRQHRTAPSPGPNGGSQHPRRESEDDGIQTSTAAHQAAGGPKYFTLVCKRLPKKLRLTAQFFLKHIRTKHGQYLLSNPSELSPEVRARGATRRPV